MKNLTMLLCCLGLTLAALLPAAAEEVAPEPADVAATTYPPGVAELLAAMDREADPCQDFYRYACGGWLETAELPADQSRWSRSFSSINERNREILRELLESAAADPGPAGTNRWRIGQFYASCMDEPAIEKAGVQPLAPLLEAIGGVEDAGSLMSVAGKLLRHGVSALLSVDVDPDFKNPDRNLAAFSQGGLGLPDRDYYVSQDPEKRKLLAAYQRHVARMLGLLGEPEETATAHAAAVVAFETELAEASRPRAEMRIPEQLYHKLDLGGLQELTPSLPWKAFLAAAGHPGITDINVTTPEFFQALEKTIAAAEPETLHAYLRWHLVREHAELLSSAFVQADFEFYGTTLSGQREIRPRWKRCVTATERALGEAVGELYVERQFAGDSKKIALTMIHDIEAAFESNLPSLAWMDATTRARAVQKVEAVTNKIGYPDAWRDYSTMKLEPGGGYWSHAMAAVEFEHDRQARKVGKAVDRSEWSMTPQRVNAYYNPLRNEIGFPAGILQPPFFHRDFPAAMNYGAIGAVVGHELTHGFDDQGRKFDPTGKLEEWWQPEVSERFETRAQCVRDLYSSYEVQPGLRVQGDLTAGENIADIGGLKQAYRAFKLWQERQEKVEPTVEGLTDDQLLFISYGQIWCSLSTPEVERVRVTTDPHSPPRFRVVGPISSNPVFAETFGCEAGDPMRPRDRCEVW